MSWLNDTQIENAWERYLSDGELLRFSDEELHADGVSVLRENTSELKKEAKEVASFLIEKLKERGTPVTRLTTQTASAIVDCFFEYEGLADETYQKFKEAFRKYFILMNDVDTTISVAKSKINKLVYAITQKEQKVSELGDEIAEKQVELDNLKKLIESTATKNEYGNRILMAEYFKNNINCNSKYDNTAYIRGLATILSGIDNGSVDDVVTKNKGE